MSPARHACPRDRKTVFLFLPFPQIVPRFFPRPFSPQSNILRVALKGKESRGVMNLNLESESESDFHHFSEIVDSNSNSDKNQFSYCTGIDSKIRYL